jgi:hypothetical protein
MKGNITVFCMAGSLVSVALGQGALIPSGSPAPTMKTLGQIDAAIAGVSNAVTEVDARTPVSEGGSEIFEGSYYLTTNLYEGLIIHEATLDLNGFTIYGDGSSETGIECHGGLVHNGTVENFGGHGISGDGVFRNLRIINNGGTYEPEPPDYSSDYYGMWVDFGVVENCIFEGNANGLRLMGGKAINNDISGYSVGEGLCAGPECYVSDNSVRGYGTGYVIEGEQCFVVRNTAFNNTVSYEIITSDSTNGVGTIRTSPIGAGPWDNFELNYSGPMP